MIVVDASVVADALTEPGHMGERARGAMEEGADLHDPHLLDLEVASFLRRRTATGELDSGRARRALEDLLLLPVRRYPHGPLLPRIWELRQNVTAYDASYIALAEQLRCPFVTADVGLGNVRAARCSIQVLR